MSLKAPSSRGFSYLEVWFVAIQLPFIWAISEYGGILAFKKSLGQKPIYEETIKKIDFLCFGFSLIAFVSFASFYAALASNLSE